MDDQLYNQLGQTIKLSLSTAVNSYGEPQYSSAVSHSARVIGRQEIVRTPDGQEHVSEKQVILSSTVSVTVLAKVWLPNESTADQGWVPIALATRTDEAGAVDFYKLFLGKTVGRNG